MRLISGALLTAAVLAVTAAPGFADLEVTAARGITDAKIGARLSDATVLDVPEGGELRLLKHPGAATYVVSGPFKGTLQQYVDRCRGVRAWFWSECSSGGKGDPLPSGGTRGISK